MSASFERTERATGFPGQTLGLSIGVPWARIVKLGGAAAILAVGVYAVMADYIAIATDNAVVSAYSVALRTPIDGVVAGAPLRIGDRVSRGATLAEVSNNRVDDQRLVDLREHLAGARAQFSAVTVQESALTTMQADLDRRSQAYIQASVARLEGSVAEAESTLAALSDRRDQAERTLNRRTSLSQGGFASVADLDKAQSDFSAGSHETAAQSARLATLRAQLAAAKQGVISEPGSNDVAYSRQRADEVAIRLKDLAQQRAVTLADVEETAARLASEEARLGKLSTATMAAPTSGMVWKVNASFGERIGAGEAIAQIVDCDAAFIIAEVPQNQVPDIEVGGVAEFRLSGDDVKRRGRILSVTGDATGGDHNLAAMPFAGKGLTATVRIAMDPVEGQCFVGRTARVLIPSSGPGWLSRLLAQFR
jgi:multidrug resistance efflux pump